MTESKTIEHHLRHIGSKVIDAARPPLGPMKTLLLAFVLVGGCLGFGVSFFLLVCRAVFKGFPLSAAGALAHGLSCSGVFSPYKEAPLSELPARDLETLRSLISFIAKKKKIFEGLVVGLSGIGRHGYVRNLAQLLAMQGQRVFVIDAVFETGISPLTGHGLWHYLKGEVDQWTVLQQEHFAFLPAGGTSRFGAELLSRERFQTLLDEARSSYDVILVMTKAPIDGIETFLQMKRVDAGIFLLFEETFDCLSRGGLLDFLQGEEKATLVFQDLMRN